MADTTFSVHLYGPQRVLVKGKECEQVFIPTVKGTIQILPDHTHLVTLLGNGILTLVSKNEKKQYAVHGGVCKILQKEIMILAKEVYNPQELKKEFLLSEKERLNTRIKSSVPFEEGEFENISISLEKIEVQLTLF